jgi:pyruvate formate lyase activating enzyme
MNGLVFDIKEFTVHDGPGIRTTVFMKGCRLRCMWCHNPEGLSFEPERVLGPNGTRLAGREYAPEDLSEVIDRLEGLHVVLDTSGYGSRADFQVLIKKVDLVYFDIKILDPALHRRYTGRRNQPILRNLELLSQSGTPYVIRVPLIPGVTDTEANLSAVAAAACGLPGLQRVDVLPYNRAAGAKYASVRRQFAPDFDEIRLVNANTRLFEEAGLEVRVA